MASGFFAILDDIAALMDDVAVTSKVAASKTAGILGDDLAVNAEKATGFVSSRELPVLWSITKGSLLNKLIIVPIALLLNAFFPVAIKVILVLGGFYLAYEGVEKIVEYFFHQPKTGHQEATETNLDATVAEKAKVKSAIMTDFILSIEIVIIALGSVLEQTLLIQIATVSIVALLATIGVYGIVALIVRMDDMGYKLIGYSKGGKGLLAGMGNVLVKSLPIMIRVLSVVGTIALILVSGGIFVHNIPFFHHVFPEVPAIVKEFTIGLLAGLILVAIVMGVKKMVLLFKR
jgi:predicted DNA repair protein MutK